MEKGAGRDGKSSAVFSDFPSLSAPFSMAEYSQS